MLPLPSRRLAPNHKIVQFVSHLLTVFPAAYKPGRDISSDDQDASFQGRHEVKQRVTYKRVGDGSLVN